MKKGEKMLWNFRSGNDPLVAAAIHAGHEIRPGLLENLSVDESTRLREEDPFTDCFAEIASSRITVNVSRFEVDLNRPRDRAVYMKPEDAWGLKIHASGPSGEMMSESLDLYDRFYMEAARFLDDVHSRYGRFALLDFHSYNHRRGGPSADPDDPGLNPDINIGTAWLDHEKWGDLLDTFTRTLTKGVCNGRSLDVRHNVRFRGGHFTRWAVERYGSACFTVAVEIKKIFMDEWNGSLDHQSLEEICNAFKGAVPVILEGLR